MFFNTNYSTIYSKTCSVFYGKEFFPLSHQIYHWKVHKNITLSNLITINEYMSPIRCAKFCHIYLQSLQFNTANTIIIISSSSKYLKNKQGSKGIRQRPTNCCISPMIIHKITTFVYYN